MRLHPKGGCRVESAPLRSCSLSRVRSIPKGASPSRSRESVRLAGRAGTFRRMRARACEHARTCSPWSGENVHRSPLQRFLPHRSRNVLSDFAVLRAVGRHYLRNDRLDSEDVSTDGMRSLRGALFARSRGSVLSWSFSPPRSRTSTALLRASTKLLSWACSGLGTRRCRCRSCSSECHRAA
jgi:hypothetical protein